MLRKTLQALFAEYKNMNVVEQMEWNGCWVPRDALERIVIPTDEIAEAAALPPTGEPEITRRGEEGMKADRAKAVRSAAVRELLA